MVHVAESAEQRVQSLNCLEQDALLQSPSFGHAGMKSFARWQPLEEVFGHGCECHL